MDLQQRFNSGNTFDDFLAGVRENASLWQAVARRAAAPDEFVRRVEAAGGRWHVLIMAEDWCGDAVNSVPPMARLMEAAANADVRIIGRDANLDVMDAHLTGTSRAIPVVLLLDEHFVERAWWGPRPAPLQQWVLGPGQALEKEDRYREVRRWYAADRNVTTLTEVVEMIERAATGVTTTHTLPMAEPRLPVG